MRKKSQCSCGAAVRFNLAPLHGSPRGSLLVPYHTSPPSRGALRSAGVPTIAASTTPAPSLARPSRRVSAASGKTLQAQGNTPCAPRGGLCGRLAVRQTSTKPPGVPTGWGSLRAEPPGRASSWGAQAVSSGRESSPSSPADSALGNSEEESRCDPLRDWREPDEQRGHAGPSARLQ